MLDPSSIRTKGASGRRKGLEKVLKVRKGQKVTLSIRFNEREVIKIKLIKLK